MINNNTFKKCQKLLANARYDAILAFDLRDYLFGYGDYDIKEEKKFQRFEKLAKIYGHMASQRTTGNVKLSEQISGKLINQLHSFLSRSALQLESGRDVFVNSREEHAVNFIKELSAEPLKNHRNNLKTF